MLVCAFLLAQAVASAPKPTPVPTPVATPTARPAPALGRAGEPARAKSLSEHAAEMKAKRTPARRVTFDDVRTVEADELEETAPPERGTSRGSAPAGAKTAGSGDVAAAQRRMDRAVERGLDVPERTRSSRRDKARREWDDAAEACRRTPGCAPVFRDDVRFGENKPLKTDQELIEDVRKRGFSEPHPLPK